MTERPKTRAAQLADVIERLERLESRLAQHDKLPAKDRAEGETSRFCALPQVPEREFASDVSVERARLIQFVQKKWVNGTKLRYYFFPNGSFSGGEDQKNLVREGFRVWRDIGIGIIFEEVTDISEAEIRIGFLRGDGAWSYVGRDVIDIPGQNERTMNFGWDLTADPRGVDTPVHEIGHTLGFPHEHQNPFAGIEWNEEAVYRYFGGPPNNWSRQTTHYNILRKLSAGEVEGSEWDPDSVMHYAFTAGLIERPEEYRDGLCPAGGLSDKDIEQARFFYPPIEGSDYEELRPFQSQMMFLSPAEQANFVVKPTSTRNYTIQTFGQSDAVMVLFEAQDGDLKYVDGDDDSGTSLNARISVRLYKGRRYILRIRLFSAYATGETAVMTW